MGSKKTKTRQVNRPVYSTQIEGAANAQNAAYGRQTGAINEFSDQLTGISSDMLSRYRETAGQPTAAQGFLNGLLESDYESNPYLEDMIAQTRGNVTNDIQTRLGTRGGIGGSAERDIITSALAEQELGLRYSDYDNQMERRLQAASLSPGADAAAYLPLDVAQQLGQRGAMLPLQAAALNSGSIGGLLGQYQDVEGEQRQSPGFMDWAGMGLQAASLFSDRRLKTDIKRVGSTDGGTPIYTYRYQGEGPYHMGVMADEVPHARGPDVSGYATVRYEEVA